MISARLKVGMTTLISGVDTLFIDISHTWHFKNHITSQPLSVDSYTGTRIVILMWIRSYSDNNRSRNILQLSSLPSLESLLSLQHHSVQSDEY